MPCADDVGGRRGAGGGEGTGGPGRVTAAGAAPVEPPRGRPRRDRSDSSPSGRSRAGETVTKEGADAAAFYLIESGTATVTVGGAFRRTLGAGEHFGEIALIDGRARSATVTADGELVCQGITLWDFQPLVQRNPTMAWTLLQTLAGMLRQAGEPQNPH